MFKFVPARTHIVSEHRRHSEELFTGFPSLFTCLLQVALLYRQPYVATSQSNHQDRS